MVFILLTNYLFLLYIKSYFSIINFKSIIMEKQEILKCINEFVIGDSPGYSIDLSENIYNSLHFDSLELMELVIKLEEEFSICIDGSSIKEWKTVGDIVDTVYQLTR